MKEQKTRKINFTGKFSCEGFIGGDVYPYWLVTEEVYKNILGDSIKYADKEGNYYKLYVNQIFSCRGRDEGIKQEISIRIVNK